MNTDSHRHRSLVERHGALTRPLQVAKSSIRFEAPGAPNSRWNRFVYTTRSQNGLLRIFQGNHPDGLYTCVGCGLRFFARMPNSLPAPAAPASFNRRHGKYREHQDIKASAWCDGGNTLCAPATRHLGHVFNDGPAPMRHALLRTPPPFLPRKTGARHYPGKASSEPGCFWAFVDRNFAARSKGGPHARRLLGGITRESKTTEDVCHTPPVTPRSVEAGYIPPDHLRQPARRSYGG